MEDSITLVISRENIIEDTINQISSTDGFDLHKEIKIFFVDEEAQDAGGVFKEWIFHVIQEIFTGSTKTKKGLNRAQSEEMLTLQKNRSYVKTQNEDRKKQRHDARNFGNNEISGRNASEL